MTLLAGILVMLGALAGPALHAAESALSEAKSNYAKLSQKIGDEHLVASANVLKTYVTSVDSAVKKCQAEGDLDSVLALREEQKRLAKKESIPPKESAGGSRAFAGLIQAAQDRLAAADKSRIERLRALNARYDEHLDRLQVSLTKKGDFDSAVKVKEEKARLAAIIKELDAQSPSTEPEEPAGKPPATAGVPPTIIKQPCLTCQGTGKAHKACPKCLGRGLCPRCAGHGTSGVGLTGQPRKCLTCKATGRCRDCDGKMKVATSDACAACKGRGEVVRHVPPPPKPARK